MTEISNQVLQISEFVTQFLLFQGWFRGVMASRGRIEKPGCEGGRAKQKFKCKVAGCDVTPRGCDLPRHYRNLTNWKMLGKLRAAMGDTEVEKLLEGADSHTTYIYRNGYSEKRLPTHNTHAMVAAQREERQNINNFFQVGKLTRILNLESLAGYNPCDLSES